MSGSEAPDTSLVYYPRPSVPPDHPFPPPVPSLPLGCCPERYPYLLVNRRTGKSTPAWCDANRCGFCAPRRARATERALRLARPAHLVTITQAGATWKEVHTRLRAFLKTLDHAGVQWSWAYHVEADPHDPRLHVHAWQRGDRVPADELTQWSRRAGMGLVDIRAVTHHGNLGYGMKAVTSLGSDTPAAVAETAVTDFVEINGGRLVHASQGFWLDRDGDPTTYKHVLKEVNASATHDWVYVRGRYRGPAHACR